MIPMEDQARDASLLNLKKGNGQGTVYPRVFMDYMKLITHKMAIETFVNTFRRRRFILEKT